MENDFIIKKKKLVKKQTIFLGFGSEFHKRKLPQFSNLKKKSRSKFGC